MWINLFMPHLVQYIDKALKILEYEPKYTLRDGLEDMIKEYGSINIK